MNRARLISTAGGYLFLAPYLIIFFAFMLLPLGFGLVLSFLDWELISTAPPRFIGFENYVEAVKREEFWWAVSATFRFVVMTVPAVTVCALGLALLLNALPERLQAMFRAAFFAPTIVSLTVVCILWRWFYNNDFGVFNAYLSHFGYRIPWITEPAYAMKSLVLMTLWWTVGGPMVILLAGLKQIPTQLYEAASIDGASPFQQFRFVTIPQLKQVLVMVFVLNTIASFQVFGQPYLVTLGGPLLSTRPMVQMIYDTAFGGYRMGYAAAMSWMLFLCIALCSFVQFRLSREK